MNFTPVRNPKAHTEIIEQICDAILRGELQKGDMLPPERDIAHQTGISRTVVREAIRTLTDIGMVKTKKGWSGGTQLINIAILNLLGDQIGDEPQALIEFYEVRNIIEIAACPTNASRVAGRMRSARGAWGRAAGVAFGVSKSSIRGRFSLRFSRERERLRSLHFLLTR